ncbi:MAG TPA: AraC family transcriptional regulator [Polyangiaceae bacterium]|nr:AraC family transcriptional regulator [Polyangiaceae bacterium]
MGTPSAVPHEGTVSSRVVSELVRAVERAGVPRAEFLRVAKIDAGWLESDDVRFRRNEVFGLCQIALDLTRDPAFGLHWGEWLTTSSFNLISHLLAHASNLHRAVETLQRFGQLVSDELRLELVEKGDTAELRSSSKPDQAMSIRRVTAEMVTIGLFDLIRHFAGPNAKVARVCFAYPAPSYRQEYARLFQGAECFDQPFTGLVFARSLLHAPSPQKDEDLYVTLSDLAARRLLRLQGRAPYSVRVRHHLMQQATPHRVSMRQVARRLGISVRSLHRRLTEEGQSYVFLANEASAYLAKQLLMDDSHTIHEAAHTMGFSNVSSFHRAFRRWTGTTPGAFRGQSIEPHSRRAG